MAGKGSAAGGLRRRGKEAGDKQPGPRSYPVQESEDDGTPKANAGGTNALAGPAASPGAQAAVSELLSLRRRQAAEDEITWKDLVLPISFATLLVIGVGILAFVAPSLKQPLDLKPIGGKKIKWMEQFQGRYRDLMTWGTYRPGYYLGVRYRMPHTLLGGLMWFDPSRADGPQKLRHEARHEDGLARYGWLQHDGMLYGKQELLDGGYNITTTWVKRFPEGAGIGGDWAINLRVEAYSNPDEYEDEYEDDVGEDARSISVLWYMGDEMAPSRRGFVLNPLPDGMLGPVGGVLLSGRSFPLERWRLHVHDNTGGRALRKLHWYGHHTTALHNMTAIVQEAMRTKVTRVRGQAGLRFEHALPDAASGGRTSAAAFQFTSSLPMDLDLTFTAGLADPFEEQMRVRVRGALKRLLTPLRERGWDPTARLGLQLELESPGLGQLRESEARRVAELQGPKLRALAAELSAGFDSHFTDAFGPMEGSGLPAGSRPVMQAALANLVGGMAFMYGKAAVRYPAANDTWAAGADKEGEFEAMGLFTCTPSRPFFPRGFLWDEGFHQLLLQRWAPLMSRDVLAHWFDLMNGHGWIGREQILGEEARARVPSEYLVQDVRVANPPTLFLPLLSLASRVALHSAQKDMPRGSQQWNEGEFLALLYWRISNWFDWYQGSQAGALHGTYRWRGRNGTTALELNPKTMASGFDDFPRASHPSDEERHLDLRCWMALAARALTTIGRAIGWDKDEMEQYAVIADTLEDFELLNRQHWDEARGQYADYGLHSESVVLERMYYRDPARPNAPPRPAHMQRNVKKPPKLQFVPQFGYVSLFPLLTKLLPSHSPQLGATLARMRDPQHLWTPYGLRSLSASASLYGRRNTEHDPPYWRGAVWMNVNYMACAALYHYAAVEGPHRQVAADIYTELRAALLGNVVREYKRTGYLWEQYSDSTGRGGFSHPFTGWTSLIVLIAGEVYY